MTDLLRSSNNEEYFDQLKVVSYLVRDVIELD